MEYSKIGGMDLYGMDPKYHTKYCVTSKKGWVRGSPKNKTEEIVFWRSVFPE